ncbi:DASS family sodium-coupled anion symporter [Francisellaceae bacterium]|nr:DASS family sodium-coupled anion symporter [Francisellaceae bacterium]
MSNISNSPSKILDTAQWVLLIICTISFFSISLLPLPGFTHQGQQALAVFSVAAILWVTNIFPIAITGIIVLFLLPVSGAISSSIAYSYFGNSSVFFILGAFILASPVMRSGLSTRIAIVIISKFGKSPRKLLCSIYVLSCLLAFVISEHAVAAMLFPIVLEIVKATGVSTNSRFALGAFLSMGWGAVIGGTATLLGGARAPLAIGMLQSNTGQEISFLQWTAWTLPIVFLTSIATLTIIFLLTRKSKVSVDSAREQLLAYKKELGKFSQREIRTLFVLAVTITLWVIWGTSWGLDWIAFLGVIMAFMLKVTNWQEVEEDVKWGIFIMYGSAIALSTTLTFTGASHSLVNLIIHTGISSPLVIFIIIVLLAFVLTEVMSNAAAVAVLMPIGIALSTEYGIDPRAIAVAIATCAGLTFMLPVSTPAMAIITHSDYVPSKKVAMYGLLLKIIAFAIFMLVVTYYWPNAGLKVF